MPLRLRKIERKKGREKNIAFAQELVLEVHLSCANPSPVALSPLIYPDDKAFKVPVEFRVMVDKCKKRVALPVGITYADQGSELNLISPALCQAIGFVPTLLKKKGFTGLTINTTNSNSLNLDSYVSFKIGVLGI